MEHNKSVKGAHDEKMTSEKSFLHSKAPISFDDEPPEADNYALLERTCSRYLSREEMSKVERVLYVCSMFSC